MTVSSEIESQILRLYHAEKWRRGTIARQLNIHHGVVDRVLLQSGMPKERLRPRKSMIDPYLPFILATLEKFPTLGATRLHKMVCERGYPGSESHFRDILKLYRKKPATEAFLRLKTLPGEQAQVDWGHFGHIIIGKAKRSLSAFVMVLSFSRKIFLKFHLNQRMANFLAGHEAAFNAWGGVPRVLLYDNLASAVVARKGDIIQFNPQLLKFSGHYRFEPRPVAVARGNEKGRVERAIRYVRDNFFAAREFNDIDDLNEQASIWCEGVAADRVCKEEPTKSVRQVFEEEQKKLLELPHNPYPTEEHENVVAGKTPYVRYDLNDYSIPHTHVRQALTVIATQKVVTILDGATVLAKHPRSYDKGEQIEQEAHINELADYKRKSRQHRGKDRLARAAPSCMILMTKAVEKGYSLRAITQRLLQLLDDYGPTELEEAVLEALSKNVPHPNAVQISLEKRREQREQLPPVSLNLSEDIRVQELVIRPHKLETYDELCTTQEHNDE